MAHTTVVPGMARASSWFESGVTTTHHPNAHIRSASRRPGRCLRHRVWMAACDDCRVARTDLLTSSRDKNAARTV